MTDYQGGVRVAAFATGGLIPPAMHGTSVLGAMHLCDIHVTFCKLAGLKDCSDNVPGLPGVDGVDVSSLLFAKEKDPSRVVGNATSPRQEIMLSTSALISGEWKFMLPDLAIPHVSAGACAVRKSRLGDALAAPLEPSDVLPAAASVQQSPPNGTCAGPTVHHDTGCTTAGHYNGDGTPLGSWEECCAACSADFKRCRAWTYHPVGSAVNPGMCILAGAVGLKAGVANATCGCLEAPCKARTPDSVSCGYWTGAVWPTKAGFNSPGYVADPGCPPGGCLFHLPSDPSEKRELSAEFPDKLAELAGRLAEIRKTAFQTWNYTAGCDECETVEEVAASHHGFVAPPCTCGSAGEA